jgi:hypothetical protein
MIRFVLFLSVYVVLIIVIIIIILLLLLIYRTSKALGLHRLFNFEIIMYICLC